MAAKYLRELNLEITNGENDQRMQMEQDLGHHHQPGMPTI